MKFIFVSVCFVKMHHCYLQYIESPGFRETSSEQQRFSSDGTDTGGDLSFVVLAALAIKPYFLFKTQLICISNCPLCFFFITSVKPLEDVFQYIDGMFHTMLNVLRLCKKKQLTAIFIASSDIQNSSLEKKKSSKFGKNRRSHYTVNTIFNDEGTSLITWLNVVLN